MYFWSHGDVNHRNLCAHAEWSHTLCMRLPQSSSNRLSIRVVSISRIVAFSALLALGAQASAQQLVCSPNRLWFGTVMVGQSESKVLSLTNTGRTSAKISAISVSGAEFKVSGLSLPLTLGARQSVSVKITFAPTEIARTDGTVTFTSNASDRNLVLGIVGTGVQSSEALTAAPSSLAFGQVAVGSTESLSVTLTNSGSSNDTLTAFQAAGTGFTVTGPALPMSLTAGQSVTLKVYFAPKTGGLVNGSVAVSGPNLNIPLTGTGTTTTTTGQLTLSPGSLNFGSVDVGTTTTQPASFTATGGSVTISSAQSNNSQFSISGALFPLTIAAGKSVAFDFVFSPSKSGASSGTVTFASNATQTQSSESLSGTGVVVASHSVSLSWSPSSSVVGYNVYRGTVSGVYSKINTSLDSNTTYTDTTVVSGATYYYAATSVNSSGKESSYSAAVKAVIP